MSSVPPPPQPSLHTHPEVPDGAVPAERPPAEQPGSLAGVPAWAPLAALLVVFMIAAIAYAVIALGIDLAGGTVTDDGPPGLVISATLIQDFALALAAVGFAALWARGLTPGSLGLRRVPFWPAIGWMAAMFAAFWVLTALLVAAFGEPEQQDLTRDLREQDALAALIGYGVLLAVVAPVTEELFFRGFLFGVLREKIGTAWGAVIGGSAFGLIHLPSSPIVSVAVLSSLGILLCLLYAKTGSLLPCIAVHAINNAISFAVTKSIPWPAAVAIVLASTGVAVAAAASVTRFPALPGALRTPR